MLYVGGGRAFIPFYTRDEFVAMWHLKRIAKIILGVKKNILFLLIKF